MRHMQRERLALAGFSAIVRTTTVTKNLNGRAVDP
jgi:hypothetical protein